MEESNNKELEAKVTELEGQIEESNKKYLYLLADFDNYKKNVQRRLIESEKYKYEPLMRELLELLDGFDRVEQFEELSDGMSMTIDKFRSFFDNHDVKKISTTGEQFDENLMEAVNIVNDSEVQDNEVVGTWTEGYMYKDKVIRFAKVSVNKIS